MESLLSVCKYLTIAILENGGETYRAEESITRLCERFGLHNADILAFPTGVILSIRDDQKRCYTEVCRVKKRSFNLQRLNEANDISRKVISGEISLFEAEKSFAQKQLKKEADKKKNGYLLNVVAGALSSGFFAVLFGGGILEFIAAMLCGVAIQMFLSTLKRMDIFHFVSNFVGSFIASVIAVIFLLFFPDLNVSNVIIGAIMPLLPGLVMTNAIRDTINGDLVSGVSRLAEVLLVAVCLAAGVGTVLSAYVFFGGTINSHVIVNGDFLFETVKALVFCSLASFFFGMLLSAPKKSLIPSAVIAALGYYVFYIFSYFGLSIMLGGFLGTMLIAISGEIFARIFKMPATVFVFPAVIPLVPGIWLYETMLFLVQGDYAGFATKGTDTVFFAGVMAGAIAVTSFLFKAITNKNKTERRHKK